MACDKLGQYILVEVDLINNNEKEKALVVCHLCQALATSPSRNAAARLYHYSCWPDEN